MFVRTAILSLIFGCAATLSAQSCTVSTASAVCSGGGLAIGALNSTATRTGNPYPSKVTVVDPNNAKVTGVHLNIVGISAHSLAGVGILLVSPSGRTLEVMQGVGALKVPRSGLPAATFITNALIEFQDGHATPPDDSTIVSSSGSGNAFFWSPGAQGGYDHGSTNYPAPAPPNGIPAPSSRPAPIGSATLASVFTGEIDSGDWQLYVIEDEPNSQFVFTSWNLYLDIQKVNPGTSSTAIRADRNPVFTTAPNNMVKFTALVSTYNGSAGSVRFSLDPSPAHPLGTVFLQCAEGAGSQQVVRVNGVAHCTTSIGAEGIHTIRAQAQFDDLATQSTTADITELVYNHSTVAGNQYCNAGPIGIGPNGSGSVYPSVINVGTDTTSIANALATLTVSLNSVSTTGSAGLSGARMLLVGPDGHSLEFLSSAGGGFTIPTSNFTFTDSAGSQIPATFGSAPGAGNYTYLPAAYSSDTFPQPPAPAPQAPGTFDYAGPAGGANQQTFTTEFNGAAANGNWALYAINKSAQAITIGGGWCLSFVPNSGAATQTSVAGSPNRAFAGVPVTVTATVKDAASGIAMLAGTVSFTGAPGAPSSPVPVNAGKASFTTTFPNQGDYKITAVYNGVSGFAISIGTYYQRIDKQTPPPFISGNTYTYCNNGPLAIPASGPADVNPTNIFVSNAPGTINSVQVDLLGAHLPSYFAGYESVLVGPLGTNEGSFDFFSSAGETDSAVDISIADSGTQTFPGGIFGAGTYRPYSAQSHAFYDVFFPSASGFFSLPPSPQRAAPAGSATFASVFQNASPNGIWSLYFNQIPINGFPPTPGSISGGWCLDINVNPPDLQLTGTNSSQMTDSGFFPPGGTGSYTITVHNNGPGPNAGLSTQVGIVLDPFLLYAGTYGGSNWFCPADVGRVLTCTYTGVVPAGADFQPLTISVIVAPGPPPVVTSQATVSGGGDGDTSNNTAVRQTATTFANLVASKVHNGASFTSGQNGSYSIKVHNIGGSTTAPVTITDTLPAGLTFVSATGTGWNCSLASTTVTCSSSTTIPFNTASSVITLTVAVNTTAATIQNTATVSGGGGSIATAQSADTVSIVQPVPPTVVSFNVLFGSQSYNLIGSTRNRLPWKITGMQVVFSKPIATASLGSIGGVTATALSGVGTSTLTWTINPLSLGTFSASLPATGPNALMDSSSNTLASAFNQTIKALWGDVNDDGVVNASDVTLVNNARAASYSIVYDLNGDGVIDMNDVNIVRSQLNTRLP
jgi:uncharacterized repeat protein (TIGR01451 family)